MDAEFFITKTSILNEIREEDIFNYYLYSYGINTTIDSNFLSPFRNDKSPTCSFTRTKNNNMLILNDWARKEYYNCFDIVVDLFGINFGKALLKIHADLIDIKSKEYDFVYLKEKNKLNEIKLKNVSTNLKQVKIKRKLYSKRDLSFWEITGLTITPQLLQRYKIYSIEFYWINDYKFPCKKPVFAYHWFDYDYQIYSPFYDKTKKELKFISPQDIIIGDEEFLPISGTHLVITKSKKDCFYLRLFGINSIFIISETHVIDDFTMVLLQSRFDNKVFTLFDNDSTGIALAKEYKKKHGTIPLWFPRRICEKDFTDNLKKVMNGVERMKVIISGLKLKYNIK